MPNSVFLCEHLYNRPWKSKPMTKLSGELPWLFSNSGGATHWQRHHPDVTDLYGAAHQWVKCAKSHSLVSNPIFWTNTPGVAPEEVGQSPLNCQGSCPGGVWQRLYPDATPVRSCSAVSKMCQILFCANPNFWINTPRIAPEAMSPSPPNFQECCHGDGGNVWWNSLLSLCKAAHQWVKCAKTWFCAKSNFLGRHPIKGPSPPNCHGTCPWDRGTLLAKRFFWYHLPVGSCLAVNKMC